MAEEETHRIQIEVPKSWLPDLEDAKNAADRSRHYMFLRFIREGLDAFSASTSEPEMENRSSSGIVHHIPSAGLALGEHDLEPISSLV